LTVSGPLTISDPSTVSTPVTVNPSGVGVIPHGCERVSGGELLDCLLKALDPSNEIILRLALKL